MTPDRPLWLRADADQDTKMLLAQTVFSPTTQYLLGITDDKPKDIPTEAAQDVDTFVIHDLIATKPSREGGVPQYDQEGTTARLNYLTIAPNGVGLTSKYFVNFTDNLLQRTNGKPLKDLWTHERNDLSGSLRIAEWLTHHKKRLKPETQEKVTQRLVALSQKLGII